jgi:hypothetical protein
MPKIQTSPLQTGLYLENLSNFDVSLTFKAKISYAFSFKAMEIAE